MTLEHVAILCSADAAANAVSRATTTQWTQVSLPKTETLR